MKDEQIERLVNIMRENWVDISVKDMRKLAVKFYNAGYRDITGLRKWLEETKKAVDDVYGVDTYNTGYADALNATLNKLESEGA